MANAEKLFSTWRTLYDEGPRACQASLHKCKQQKDEFYLPFKASVELLESEIQNLKEKKTCKEQAAVGEEKRLHLLTEDIDEKLRKREHKDNHIAALMSANSSLKRDVEVRKKNLEELQDSITHVQKTYSERLGFTISAVRGFDDEHHFEFKFNNIDFKDPHRTFSIALKISNEKKITVTDCEPMIKDLDLLLGDLLKTNDWHRFTVTLRRRFAKLV